VCKIAAPSAEDTSIKLFINTAITHKVEVSHTFAYKHI
jgi:hypothetical protein